MEQMRRRMADVEKKHTRTVHDLNKEIAELENLVEAKIYREDDLEREIERLKEKVSRRAAKASNESREPTHSNSNSQRTSVVHEIAADELVCEVCGEKGHDLLSCHLVFDSQPKKASTVSPAAKSEELWCQDCESRGHTTDNCPYSQDVF